MILYAKIGLVAIYDLRGGYMLTYALDKRDGISLYDYLYRCIKEDILKGNIVSGEKLPSKRSLAKNLGISVITVENAYAQLCAEGFIYSLEKRGYYAADIRDILTDISDMPNDIQNDNYDNEKSDNNILDKNKSYNNKSDNNKTVSYNEEVMNEDGNTDIAVIADFASNAVNIDKFPFYQWSRLTRNVLAEANDDLLRVAPIKGVYELRKAIADYLYRFRGLKVNESQIVVGSGTEYMYGILIQLLGHDKVYAMEDPGYSKMSMILEGNRVKCHHVAIDDCGMMIDRLNETDANVVHLTPSHHFPSGIVMPIQRRLEFISWAMKQEDRYIIEDDYDCEFRLQGRPIQTMFESDMNGKVIYMNTFSKTLAPSFRISYMVLPHKLMKLFEERLGYMSCTVPNLEQYVLARFMSEGYYERHINRMRVYYRNLRNEILKEIRESRLNGRCQIFEEDAGLHFLIKLNTEMSDEMLVAKALEKGIKLTCISQYTYNATEENEHVVVLNYSGIKMERIKESVTGLSEIIAFLN